MMIAVGETALGTCTVVSARICESQHRGQHTRSKHACIRVLAGNAPFQVISYRLQDNPGRAHAPLPGMSQHRQLNTHVRNLSIKLGPSRPRKGALAAESYAKETRCRQHVGALIRMPRSHVAASELGLLQL